MPSDFIQSCAGKPEGPVESLPDHHSKKYGEYGYQQKFCLIRQTPSENLFIIMYHDDQDRQDGTDESGYKGEIDCCALVRAQWKPLQWTKRLAQKW